MNTTKRVRRPLALGLYAMLAALVFGLAGVAVAGAGRLGPGDEQLGSGEYFDRVTFVGTAGDVVVIDLNSSEFDPYLILIDADEQVLAQEDDTPEMGLNARITLTLPTTGQYTVIVTSAYAGESGGYRLSISTQAQAAALGSQPKTPVQQPGQTPTQPPAQVAPLTPVTPGEAQPLSVIGTVIDSHGRPIAGATVRIQPAITTGQVSVRTDANGRYIAERLVDVPYKIRAWNYIEYGGQQICVRLGMESPADYDSFVVTNGAVRNFVHQLTGPIEDLRPDFFYGGMLHVGFMNAYVSPGERVELSFTPAGPLINGTAATPFTRTIDSRSRSPDDVLDIPIAAYHLSATHVGSDGSRQPIRIQNLGWGDRYEPSVLIDWTGSGDCDNGNGFDWIYVYLEEPEYE